MNFENPTPAAEKEPRYPSLEEIKSQIERLSGQENLEVIRMIEDEKGIYLYEATAVDEFGDASVFSYRRSGNYTESKAANTVIDVTYYMGSLEEDTAFSGATLSDYDETTGIWIDAE